MSRIELQERQAKKDPVELDAPTAGALAAQDTYVNVSPSGEDGKYILEAKHYVGAFRVGQTEIWIRPKVPAPRLLYLLGFRDPDRWYDTTAALGEADHLVPMMTLLFTDQVDRVLNQGACYGYRRVNVTGPALRGRLREADQMRRRRGLAHPVEVRQQEHTIDVPENQLLLAAVRRLQSLGEFTTAARRLLQQCVKRLAGVSELPAGRPLPATRIPRHNPAYGPALQLARLILGGRSVEMVRTGTADVPVTGFLLNMEKVFEDYLALALKRELAHVGRVEAQDTYHLAPGKQLERKPDVTFRRDDACVAVLDAKYRSRTKTDFSADVNQVIVYCVTLGASHGYLVYVGNRSKVEPPYDISSLGIKIHVRSLNLEQDIPGLQRDIRQLAGQLASA